MFLNNECLDQNFEIESKTLSKIVDLSGMATQQMSDFTSLMKELKVKQKNANTKREVTWTQNNFTFIKGFQNIISAYSILKT